LYIDFLIIVEAIFGIGVPDFEFTASKAPGAQASFAFSGCRS
jgi:hypothetical protein